MTISKEKLDRLFANDDPEIIAARERVKTWDGSATSQMAMRASAIAKALTGIDQYSFIIGKCFQAAAANSPAQGAAQMDKVTAVLRALRDAMLGSHVLAATTHPDGPGALKDAQDEVRMLIDMLNLSILENGSPEFQARMVEEIFAQTGPVGHA